jgi:biotin operon repressor
MNFATLSPPDALRKALKAKQGHPSPYRPESRLIQTEAARARVAIDLRLAVRKRKKVGKSYTTSQTYPPRHRGINAGLDRKILSLRERGLWPSEIAPVLGIRVQSVYLRLQALKKAGFTIPSLTIPRPNPLRKVSDEKILALAQSGLSIPEIAAKVGIATNNVWKRIKHLSRRS